MLFVILTLIEKRAIMILNYVYSL